MRRLVAVGRSFGRGSPRFQGIRFRLGVAMALALLPIFIVSIIQTQLGISHAFRA